MVLAASLGMGDNEFEFERLTLADLVFVLVFEEGLSGEVYPGFLMDGWVSGYPSNLSINYELDIYP